MKRALILGVSGQDGAFLSELLLNKGYEVYGTSRDAQMSSFENLKKIGVLGRVQVDSVSLNDFRSVLQALTRIKPDEIYNLAGQSSVALSFKQPVEAFESVSVGNLNLLEAIRFMERPVKFYNACSSECFGNTAAPADENTCFSPRSPYAVSKAAAFWEVANYREAYGIFACSGILSNHESYLRPERFVTKKIIATAARIANGSQDKLKLGNISIERDWGWAPEYCEAMWMMLQQKTPGDFVIATGEAHKLEDFLAAAFKRVGLDWRTHVEFDETLKRPTDVSVNKCNPKKAADVLGWKAKFKMSDVVDKMMEYELNENK